jgi:hypothetical protein
MAATTNQDCSPESCASLLTKLRHPAPPPAKKLVFQGVGNRDVYNIAAPFRFAGRRIIAGRVEQRKVELSEIVLFAETDGVWKPIPGAPTFPGLQDPCVAFLGGELVLGGVRFPVTVADGTVGWRMEFYRGSSLDQLKLCFTGPDKMKDIRLVELSDERVGVLTRPQGEKGGRGQIGFFVADNLQAITAEAMEAAPLFRNQCQPDEWVGANEAHRLANGLVGVLGHIACFDRQEHRHYYPMVFCFDPRTREATSPVIIARRTDFPTGAAKRPDVADVIFSGGLVRHGDGTATLYAGLSDTEAGCLTLSDPFEKHAAAKPQVQFDNTLRC